MIILNSAFSRNTSLSKLTSFPSCCYMNSGMMKFATIRKTDFIFYLTILILTFARPSVHFQLDESDESLEDRGGRAARLCKSTSNLSKIYIEHYMKRNIFIRWSIKSYNQIFFFRFSECFHGCQVSRSNLRLIVTISLIARL